MNPELSDAIAASWSLPLWPTLALLLTALLYWRGWRVARLTRAAELPAWRPACFFLGLAAVWLAIASPLDALGGLLLLAHMAQHLVLMSIAPPLLLLGAPQVPLLRGLPRSWARDAVGPVCALLSASLAIDSSSKNCSMSHRSIYISENLARRRHDCCR